MQVFTGAASCRTGNADDIPRPDSSPFPGKDTRQVALADRVVSMPEGYILAGGFVLPDFHYHSRHHGHYLVAPRMEVDSVVKLSFSGKRVFPIPIKRVDFHPAQRIAYAILA